MTQKIKTHKKKFTLFDMGFTLIELLIAMAIIAVISTVVIANFHNGQKDRAAALSADIVVNAIHDAQAFSASGKLIANSNCSSGQAPVAYLIYANPSDHAVNLYALDKCGSQSDFSTYNLVQSYPLPESFNVWDANMSDAASDQSRPLELGFTLPYGDPYTITPSKKIITSFSYAFIEVAAPDGTFAKKVYFLPQSKRTEVRNPSDPIPN